MKISVKQFARSLYTAVDGKSKIQIKQAIKNFSEILIKHNQLTKVDAIINEFVKIWLKEKKIVEAEAISAGELNKATINAINDYLKKITRADKVNITEKIDKNIIGGIIIRYGDKILDGSIRAKLSDLKSKMIK